MIHTELNNDIKILRIEHGKANAIDNQLLDVLLAVTADSPARGLIITGAGRFFSAGLNLPLISQYSRPDFRDLMRKFHQLQIRFLKMPVPVIAAINGHCIAGGYILAMSCDYRVAVNADYRIGLNEMVNGIILPPIATERMHCLFGQKQPDFLFSNHPVSPQVAFTQGMVDEIVVQEQLLESSVKFIKNFDLRQKWQNNTAILEKLSFEFEELYAAFFRKWFSKDAQNHIARISEGLKSV